MDARAAAYAGVPVVLSIAGFDPTGGAGVGADLKVLAAHNCYGVAVVTCLTVQNTDGFERRHDVPAALLSEQIAALAEDIPLAGIKVGMLGCAANVEAVAATVERYPPPFLVLDPLLRSANGAELLEAAGVQLLRQRLLPRATVVTPSMEEAEALTGQQVQTVEEIKAAAVALHRAYGVQVVITGGHLEKLQDLFYDGSQFTAFAGDRIRSQNTHGASCAFSTAVAANLALGKPVPDSVVLAKAYVAQAIEKGYALGRGRGLLNHLYRLQSISVSRSLPPEPAEVQPVGHR